VDQTENDSRGSLDRDQLLLVCELLGLVCAEPSDEVRCVGLPCIFPCTNACVVVIHATVDFTSNASVYCLSGAER
jgi:hypothetical protein